MEKKVVKLEERVKNVVDSMVLLLQNQQTQTDLLRQLVQAQGTTPLHDDNKKVEKKQGEGESSKLDVQISQVLVPAITTTPTLQIKGKLDGIDLIYLAADEMKLKEQRRLMDDRINQVFGSTIKSDTVNHVTKVESITMEPKQQGRYKVGETPVKNLKPIVLKPKTRSDKGSSTERSGFPSSKT